MHEFIQGGELKLQAKRLLGYRLPMILVIIVNIVLIVRIPMPAARQAQAQSPATSQWAAFRDRISAQMAPHAPAPSEQLPADAQLATPLDTSPVGPDTEPDRQLPLGVGLTLIEPSDDTFTEPIQSDTTQQADAPLPLNAADLAADDPIVTETVSAAIASLPTIPLTTWQQDAQQLVHRWKQSAHNMLSTHRASLEDAKAAAAIEPSPAVELSGLPPTTDAADPTADSPAGPPRHAEPGLDTTGLAVRNPRENNGTIRFLVNRRLYELLPGEAHQFPPTEAWLIQFHPGGEFENVERTVTNGVYQFTVTQHGWDLAPVETDR